MKRFLLAGAAIVFLIAPVRAEDVLPGTPVALLAHERVRKELNLTEKQSAEVSGLKVAVSKGDSKLADAQSKLDKTLKAEQLTRLKEISYQVRGGAALADKSVAEALKLSKKQIAEVEEVWQDEEKKLKMLLAVARFRNAEAMKTFITNHRKKAAEKMLGVLSDEQKKEFTKMQGKTFETDRLDKE